MIYFYLWHIQKHFGSLLSSFGKRDLIDWSQVHLFFWSVGIKSSPEQVLNNLHVEISS